MIQRIQTSWLFLASLVIFGLFLFPYLNYNDLVGLGKNLMVTGQYAKANNEMVRQEFFLLQTIVTVLVALIPILIIFQYKNRKLQLRLIYVSILSILLLAAYLLFTANTVLSGISQAVTSTNIGVGLFLLPVSIICLALAIGGIRKDEKLIQSANRLR